MFCFGSELMLDFHLCMTMKRRTEVEGDGAAVVDGDLQYVAKANSQQLAASAHTHTG